MDPRATALAEVFLDHSLGVTKGTKLLLAAGDFTPMDLLKECYRLALLRGALVELDVFGFRRSDFGGFSKMFLATASDEQLSTASPITFAKIEWADALLSLNVVHDDFVYSEVDPAKISLHNQAYASLLSKIVSKKWVLTQYPTESLAAKAGMSLPEFTDFYYAACLIDYAAESARLQKLQDVLDAGSVVRIRANGTDISLGIEGRLAAGTNVGRRNVPDGECFLAPLEDQTEGVITFELPQPRVGNEVSGIRLEFRSGKIVSATAEKGEALLLKLIDEHPDNRRLGELGIGMNRSITKYMRNTLFDEKIAGTIHMALGKAYEDVRGGGLNKGTIHWDLVKDLRCPGTTLEVDGQVIIRDGEVLV